MSTCFPSSNASVQSSSASNSCVIHELPLMERVVALLVRKQAGSGHVLTIWSRMILCKSVLTTDVKLIGLLLPGIYFYFLFLIQGLQEHFPRFW